MKKFQAIMVACLIAVVAIPCAIAQEAKTAPNKLLVGAAVRDITPKSEWLPLFGVAKSKMVGVIDPIHVRVIALSNGKTPSLLVTFEMSGVPPAETFLTALSKHTGVPIDAIFYGATHCHSAPNTTIDPNVPSTQLYSKFVNDQMMDAADTAVANMQPATVGIGYSESYINVNRQGTFTKPDGTIYGTQGYNPTGPSDKTLAAIRFDDMKGKPIAFIVNYAVHNTIMYANRFNKDGVGISADLGGYVSTCMETKFDGSVAIWLPGASGNQNPILSNEHFTPSIKTGEQEVTFFPYAAVELLRFFGKVQFADVLTALSRIKTVSSDAKVNYAYGGGTVPAYTDGEKDFSLQLKLLRIGDIALVGNPGEMFNSIGVYMKNHSLLKNTLIANNCRTYTEQYTQFTTYMPDDEAIMNNGFHGNPKLYKVGSINDGFATLMNKLISSTK